MITCKIGDVVRLKYGRPLWVRKNAINTFGQPPLNLIEEREDHYFIDVDPFLKEEPASVVSVECDGRVLNIASRFMVQRFHIDWIQSNLSQSDGTVQ